MATSKSMIREIAMKLLTLSATAFALTLVSVQAMAGVYKCDDGAGNITYSQTPCATDAKEMDMSHAGKSTSGAGGESGLRAGEIRALREIEYKKEMRRIKREAADSKRALEARFDEIDKQYDSAVCEIYSRGYDRIRSDLRKGYTRAKGERLRRYESEYKDQMEQHCK